MATFTLTAKHQSTRTGGFHIDKGDKFVIHINMAGITQIIYSIILDAETN